MVNDAKLTSGPVLVTMLRFGAPLALAMAFHGLFNCVDLVIVGRIGPGAVAAVTIGGIINMVSMLAFSGIADVVAGKASSVVGQNKRQELATIDATSRALTWGASLLFAVLFVALASPLVAVFGLDEATEESGRTYLIILSAGSGTMFFLLYQSAILRALGASRAPMIALVGANVANLALDVLLVFGLAGFPELGVIGAAWATVISRLMAAVWLGRYLKKRRQTWPQGRVCTKSISYFLRKGLAHASQMVVRVASVYGTLVVASGVVVENRGVTEARDLLDGVGVAIRLEMIILFCSMGWGTACASFIGQNFGAGRFDRARTAVISTTVAALLSGFGLGLLLFFFARDFLQFVAPDGTVASLEFGVTYLEIVILGHAGLIFAIVMSQTLVGLGSVWTAVILDAGLYLIVLVPLAAIWATKTQDPTIVWQGVRGAHFASIPLYLLFFRKRFLTEKQKVAPTSVPAP